MLNKRQIKQLKALSSTLTIKYQIGKNEVNDKVIDLLDKALTAHELIKIDVLKGYLGQVDELGNKLCNELKAELVHIIGRNIVLYRKNVNKPSIKLVS